jgi:Sec-independent protein secretion pathway component TatC
MKNMLTLLRRIVVATLLTFGAHFIMFVICWIFRDQAAAVVDYATRRFMSPPDGTPFATPYGSLNTTLSGALLLSSPFIVGSWFFSLSGGRSRRYQVAFILSCVALAACGAVFGYYVAFPLAGEFHEWTRAAGLLRGENYHDLVLQAVTGLGIVFQMPAVIFALQVGSGSET